MKDYLKPSEVAKMLDKSSTTITRWIHKGKFKGVKRVGDEFRIPLMEVTRFIQSTQFNPKHHD